MQLREWLEKEGVTQEQLGDRIRPPVSRGKVSHWLNGTRRINLGEAIQVHDLTRGEVGYMDLWRMYRGAGSAVPESSASGGETEGTTAREAA